MKRSSWKLFVTGNSDRLNINISLKYLSLAQSLLRYYHMVLWAWGSTTSARNFRRNQLWMSASPGRPFFAKIYLRYSLPKKSNMTSYCLKKYTLIRFYSAERNLSSWFSVLKCRQASYGTLRLNVARLIIFDGQDTTISPFLLPIANSVAEVTKTGRT